MAIYLVFIFFCARLRPLLISVFRMVVLFFGNNIDNPVQCNIGTSIRIWLDAMDVQFDWELGVCDWVRW